MKKMEVVILITLKMPVKCISGHGCVKQNSSVFAGFGKRCLIVTGKHSAVSSGALKDVLEVLEKENIEYSVFNEIGANPLISACHKAGEQANEFNADFIVGIGGGSVLDSSKAVAIFASDTGLSGTDIYNRKINPEHLPVILIGTTAGTGSEVTAVAVLTNDESGIKKSIKGEDCYAAVSFLDPAYTASMSYYQTCSTALDAFAHAVEGYFTSKCSGLLSFIALKAINSLYSGLKELSLNENISSELRDKLYYASIDAGFVINSCGTGFPHPLGYVLTENYGVPHGMACEEFFGDYIDRCLQFSKEKASAFEENTDKIENVKALIKSLVKTEDISMTEEQAVFYASRWLNSVPGNFSSSPGGLTYNEALEILKKHFCGKDEL